MKSIITALCLILTFSCGGKQTKGNSKKEYMEKSIIIFFSHAGENYSVGNIVEGNTKLVADVICQNTGADLLEIVCKKNYNLPYSRLCDLAKKELQDGEYPDFTLILNGKEQKGKTNLSTYKRIYIGGPVWWGTYPQVMFSFFKEYDLSGKTIQCFTTHEGSGLGRCESDLKNIYPKASFDKAFSIYGHEVRTDDGKKKIMNWIKQ